MRAILVAISLAAVAYLSPAAAAELPPSAETALTRGRPWVEVTRYADGASGQVRAAIDIAAPQDIVWALMTDCGLAPKFLTALKSCRVLDRDPDGRWEVREEISKPSLLPSLRTVFRDEFDPPDRMTFHVVEGDLKVLEGGWRLTRHGAMTRVTYEARMAAAFKAPGWVARTALRIDVPNALTALRRDAESRAGADPSWKTARASGVSP